MEWTQQMPVVGQVEHFEQSAEVHAPPHQMDPQHTVAPAGTGAGQAELLPSGAASLGASLVLLGESTGWSLDASATKNTSGTPQPRPLPIHDATTPARAARPIESIPRESTCNGRTGSWAFGASLARVSARVSASVGLEARGHAASMGACRGLTGQSTYHLACTGGGGNKMKYVRP
jgi:hypothetical protein